MEILDMRKIDLHHVVQHVPLDLAAEMKHENVFIAGGFVRAVIGGEEVNDIDLFSDDSDTLYRVLRRLEAMRNQRGDRCRIHRTQNAITLITEGRTTIQGITRWKYANATDTLASFDFTVCQGVVWRERATTQWHGLCGDAFYPDLAARRLVYTNPVREEEAGGSMLRVLKYTKRGYSIQVKSLGAVIARLADKVDAKRLQNAGPIDTATVIAGLLREVDPSMQIDGLDIVEGINGGDQN